MGLHKDRGIAPERHIAVLLLRRSIKGGTGTSNALLTFEEALDKLEQSGLKPGQTVISRSKVMKIVESYDPVKASSSGNR